MFKDSFTIIAGPCAVESKAQMKEIAKFLSDNGIEYLRGGAYKPRSSPYSFQGLGKKGMDILRDIQYIYQLKIVTELLDIRDTKQFDFVDVIQIGARNMYNYSLLNFVGDRFKDRNILLKRGLAATITDLLNSAEYLKFAGSKIENIILCERGIMRHGQEMRNILDIAAVPYIQQTTEYKVIVDPSHSTGRRSLIPPVSKAAKAIGAMGIIVEVHNNPCEAKSDSAQQLNFKEFSNLLKELDYD